MHVHIVVPVTTDGLSTAEHFAPHARQDTVVTVSRIETGPASIESHFDEAVAGPGILQEVVRAEAEGADAIVIDCMGDPVLAAAREVTSCLVLGPAQTSMSIAANLAMNFSIVTTGASVLPIFDDLTRRYGVSDKVCSIRAADVPVLDLHDSDRVRTALTAQSIAAVADDGAHAIVLGCTGMRGWAEHIATELDAAGWTGIPVIDPVIATFKVAEALADLGLTPSARTYGRPPVKPVVGYGDLAERVQQ